MSQMPVVSITCGDCGTCGDSPVGEDWWCDGCGVTWQVAADPAAAAELERIRRSHRQAVCASLGAVLVLCAMVALVGDRGAALFALPGGIALWLLAVLPHLRRRYRSAVGQVGAWTVSKAPTAAIS